MKKHLLFFIATILYSLISFSQINKNTPFKTTNFQLIKLLEMQKNVPTSAKIHLEVKGNKILIKRSVEDLEGFYKGEANGYSRLWIPAKKLKQFLALPFVHKTNINLSKGKALSNKMLINNNIVPLHNGIFPLPKKYDGKGVLMGIIDTDIDYHHPDFKDSLGNTRILNIWDQKNASPSNSPIGYGYGQEWDSTSINNGSITYLPNDQHGTNVSGVACSNGGVAGIYQGGASASDIVFVVSDLNSLTWTSTIADAVQYIFAKADSLGIPCVINLSLGSYNGSHDGTDSPSQLVDSMLKAKNGRALIHAAGNAGALPKFHLSYPVTADTSFTWFSRNAGLNIPPYAPNGAVFFEIWADSSDFNNVHFSIGTDMITPYKKRAESVYFNMPDILAGVFNTDANGIVFDTLKNSNGDKLGMVYLALDILNDTTYMVQGLVNPDSIANYTWRFSTTGWGSFDAWATSNAILGYSDIINTNLPTVTQFADIIKYKKPDSLQSIVSNFNCLESVISVANYNNRDSIINVHGTTTILSTNVGEIANSSSRGPNRKRYIKPDIAAPGDVTMTAFILSKLPGILANDWQHLLPDSLHKTAGGTSMASPSVAGAVALLLQKCSTINYALAKQMILNTARQDIFTINTPNNQWGYGKLDAFNAMLFQDFTPTLSTSGNLQICNNMDLTVDNAVTYDSIIWNNAVTSDTLLAINQDTIYYAAVITNNGCFYVSDTLNLSINPFQIPNQTISIIGDTLFCENDNVTISVPNNFSAYAWSNATNTSSQILSVAGSFSVTVMDVNGCIGISDTINLFEALQPLTPTIFRSENILTASISNQYQWYKNDTLLLNDTTQSLTLINTGSFIIASINPNGCSAFSIPFIVDSLFSSSPTSIKSLNLDNDVLIYPNPSKGKFNVIFNTPITNYNVLVIDALGRIVKTYSLLNSTSQEISIANSGVYFFKIYDNKQIIVRKVIVE